MTYDRTLDGTYAGTLADFEPEPHQQLVRIDEARQALAQVATVDDARKIVDVAEAMRVYAKKAHLGLEAQNYAAEIKMLAERRCGELLRDDPRLHAGNPQLSHDARIGLQDLDIGKDQSSRWQKVAAVPEVEFVRYIADKKDSGQEVTTAGLLTRRDTNALQSSESYEWYTPSKYIEAARRVLGDIDLDPASSAEANEVVRATVYLDRNTDGLSQDWHGHVWLNPPYGGAQALFTERLVDQYKKGNIKAAILLVNSNSTDTDWFQPLWDYLLCFTRGRINFVSPGGEVQAGSTHGSVFIYLGLDWDTFAREFEAFGNIVSRYALSA